MASFEIADEMLQAALDQSIYSGVAYAIAWAGDVLAVNGYGKTSFASDAGDVNPHTIFDVASLTKPVATATSILQLVERGKLHLRQSVTRFFEDEFGPLPHLQGVEVHHLLTHTAGLPPIPQMSLEIAQDEAGRTALLREVLMTAPLRPAGDGFTYSDMCYILLGEIVARASGQSLPDWFRENVAAPLGLKHTGFRPGSSRGVAVTEAGISARIVHDPRARALMGIAGHAGLFSTVEEILKYAEAIRTGGAPIVSRASQARMAVSQIPASVGGQSYGWFCVGNGYLPNGDLFSDRSYG